MIINTFFIQNRFCIWIDILSKTNQNINAAHRFILSVLTEKWDLRLREACPGLLYTPPSLTPPHVKTVPREMRRNMKRKGENGIASSNFFCNSFVFVCKTYFLERDVRYSQVVTPTRNSCSALPIQSAHTQQWIHTHREHTPGTVLLAILHFSFVILYFCLQKAHYFFSILHFLLQNIIFFCNTSILLQIYAALFWLHTKPTHLHPLDVDPTPPPGLFCS